MESLQKQLVSAILTIYTNAIAKKVDVDNFLDIHLPDVHDKKGTHLFFNTAGGNIKLGFYCRDNDFVENAINSSDQIERYSQGLRLLNNPQFDSVEDAISNAQSFINIISNNSISNPNLQADTSVSIDNIDLNKLDALFENYSTDNDELKFIKSIIVEDNEFDEIVDFNNAIHNFKNQKIEEVAKYVEAGNPVLQFSNDNDVIDNYLISMVSGGNLTQSRLNQYLAKGLDINATTSDDDQYTACHFAAWDGNEEVLSMLIDSGANPDVVGGDTMTPLNLASANGHLDCVKLLIGNNVNLDNRVLQGNIYHSSNGGTALRDSLLNLFWDVADVLITAGASVSVLNEKSLNGDDFIEVLTQFAKESQDSKYNLSRLEAIKNLVLVSQTKSGEFQDGIDDKSNSGQSDNDFGFDMSNYDIETDFQIEDFDVSDESVIDFISNKIHKGKYLTNLLYVNKALEKNGFEVDNHQAYFFDSDVLISDRELSGFLLVNMDGFYSNCISENELNMLISWDAVTNLVYSETDNDSSIDIITDQGELTIKKINSFSLKILNTFYISLWKEIIEKFIDEPYIYWNEVPQLGVTEIGFDSIQEYKDFKIK